MEDAARELAQEFGASINVTIGEALARDFPAIDTVGRAAESPPRLIDMSWGESGPVITLVGKGVTFDSGGLDIKPSSAMEMMKKDMGGAAIVLGLAQTIMALNLPVRLRVLVPTAENAISDKAMRPLDVIDTAAGIPVEVGNTDAEGRLILADAIHLATSGTEKPDMLIDFATLTGAQGLRWAPNCLPCSAMMMLFRQNLLLLQIRLVTRSGHCRCMRLMTGISKAAIRHCLPPAHHDMAGRSRQRFSCNALLAHRCPGHISMSWRGIWQRAPGIPVAVRPWGCVRPCGLSRRGRRASSPGRH